MQEMTKSYVFRTLIEEHLWKTGEEDTFEVTLSLSQKWEFTLKREEEQYLPYKYSLTGRKLELVKHGQEDIEVWGRHFYIL